MKQKRIKVQKEIDKSKILLGGFDMHLNNTEQRENQEGTGRLEQYYQPNQPIW